MKKIPVLLVAALFTGLYSTAQNTDSVQTPSMQSTPVQNPPLQSRTLQTPAVASPAKAVYAEVGGPGIASINFDMRLTKTLDGIGFRAGFGGWSIEKSTVVFVPLGLNYITSKNNRDYFEAGAGGTIVSNSIGDGDGPFQSSFGFLNLGYRKQPAEGGYFFRATLTPVFGKGFFWPYYGGVSFGYTF